MRRPPCFLWEGRAEKWQGTTTQSAGMSTSCGAVVEKVSAGRARTGDQQRVPGTVDGCCDDGGTNHAEDEDGSAHGRAAHRASRGVPGMVPSGEPGRRLQEPAPGFRCSYPPAGRCWASVPGHRHVRSHQCDAAPTRIAAAVRRTVTAAGSDGPHLSHAEPGGPSLAAAGVFPGAVGSIPLSAMHPMICPMGSDGVFNMRLI